MRYADVNIAQATSENLHYSLKYAQKYPEDGFPLLVPRSRSDGRGDEENVVFDACQTGQIVWCYSNDIDAMLVLGRICSKSQRAGFSVKVGWRNGRNTSMVDDVVFLEADSLTLTPLDLQAFRLNFTNDVRKTVPTKFACLSEESTFYLKVRMQAASESELYRKLTAECAFGGIAAGGGAAAILRVWDSVVADFAASHGKRPAPKVLFDFSKFKFERRVKRVAKKSDLLEGALACVGTCVGGDALV